jgi:hypothetical protein
MRVSRRTAASRLRLDVTSAIILLPGGTHTQRGGELCVALLYHAKDCAECFATRDV